MGLLSHKIMRRVENALVIFDTPSSEEFESQIVHHPSGGVLLAAIEPQVCTAITRLSKVPDAAQHAPKGSVCYLRQRLDVCSRFRGEFWQSRTAASVEVLS